MTIGGDVLVSGGLTRPRTRRIGGGFRLAGELLSSGVGSRRRTVVVDQAGTPVDNGWLADAVHGPITWEPSTPETWSITVPLSSKADAILGAPSATEWGIEAPYREVQLWYGNRVLSWGPAVSPRVDGDQLVVAGAGAGWYLNRKIGPGARPNLLNVDDDNPLDGWWIFNTGPGFAIDPPAVGAEIEESGGIGQWSGPTMRVISTLAADPNDDLVDPVAVRFIRINAAAFAHTYTFSAWRQFQTWTRPNLRRSGLGLAILDTNWTNLYSDVRWAAWESLTEQRSDTAERAKVSIEVPASGVDLILACIVTAPRGNTFYWGFDLDCDVGLEFSDEDQADIAFKVADHCNGNQASPYTFATRHPLYPWAGADIAKSDVNVDTYCPRTGITRDRRFLFPNQTTGISALADFADLDDGLEWDHQYTSRQRTFTTHCPKLGRYRPNCPLRLTPAGSTITAAAWAMQGDQGANAIHVLTAGDSRTTATAIDTSDFADGLTLDQVLTAPVDIADIDLAAYADARRQRTRRPITLACKLPADPYWTDRGLCAGDRVPVTITRGALTIAGVMRVTRLTLTPDDQLELLLTPWPDGET